MSYLKHYIENNVESTLAHVRMLYRRGVLNDEDYIQIVSELTELYSDYGESVSEIADRLYAIYAEEVEM